MTRWQWLWAAYSVVTLAALVYTAGPRPRYWAEKRWIVPTALLIAPPVAVFVLGVRAGAAEAKRAGRLPRKCQKCGYDLNGNVSGVCPECGEVAA